MKIKFDFEARDEFCAFFALYAGLRMYKEQKDEQTRLLNEKQIESEKLFSIPAAEAYCVLEDLREQKPKMYNEAVEEYNEVYGTKLSTPTNTNS